METLAIGSVISGGWNAKYTSIDEFHRDIARCCETYSEGWLNRQILGADCGIFYIRCQTALSSPPNRARYTFHKLSEAFIQSLCEFLSTAKAYTIKHNIPLM